MKSGRGTGLSHSDEGLLSRDVELRDIRRDWTTGGTYRRTARGRDGMEFSPSYPIFAQFFPFRWQVGPVLKLKACYPEIVERKFSSSVLFLPISSHVHILQYQHASRRRRRRQKEPEQMRSAAVIPKWYAGVTRTGKQQLSSNLPNAIALGRGATIRGRWPDR